MRLIQPTTEGGEDLKGSTYHPDPAVSVIWNVKPKTRLLSVLINTVVCFFLLVCIVTNATGGERYALSAADQAFLEDLSHRAFLYFWEQADPGTGLVFDRARADGSPHDETHRGVASIAATGFGLTALCIASARGWVRPAEARDRVRVTLHFLVERAPRVHGWFYHWMDARTGERKWNSEVSSIDTALLLGGVLTAKQFFRRDNEIVRLATRIYEDIDFPWMQRGHPALVSHGWKPENGFLAPMWDSYSEQTILYLLAIGSPVHPITSRSWWAWRRDWISYGGYSYLAGARPLFIHQYSQAWVDYRGRREKQPPNIDYFDNSIKATRAHRAFCIDMAGEFPGYSENIWGITASDSAKGYVAWGGPPRDPDIDGTVVPSAAAGSLMFTPDICLPALRAMLEKFGERGKNIWGRYGFVDAFNPGTGWVDRDVIGINAGITLLSAENLRTGNVWLWFMRNAEIRRALQSVGLVRAGASVGTTLRGRLSSRRRIASRKALARTGLRDHFAADNRRVRDVWCDQQYTLSDARIFTSLAPLYPPSAPRVPLQLLTRERAGRMPALPGGFVEVALAKTKRSPSSCSLIQR